jgi:repressor LexA
MQPHELKEVRTSLGLTQDALAQTLNVTRQTINRYEQKVVPIPMTVELALMQLSSAQIPLAGVVAAGAPIEPIPQMERVEVPKSMVGRGETFALRVKGTSMRDEGIFSGDVVVVQKQATVRNGQTVIALVNGEATIKTYYRKAGTIELHPANDAMQPIVIKPSDSFQIEGIVVGVIRHLRK